MYAIANYISVTQNKYIHILILYSALMKFGVDCGTILNDVIREIVPVYNNIMTIFGKKLNGMQWWDYEMIGCHADCYV